jgi:ribosomal protein L16 Arg81 hydroxylase
VLAEPIQTVMRRYGIDQPYEKAQGLHPRPTHGGAGAQGMTSWLLPDTFDRETFLRDYWQKKPLLIRGSGNFADPISPDELAGLACEAIVESRLVQSDAARKGWTVRHGPFAEKDFSALPDTHWSLLVQAVDQWHEGVREMLREFDFIPRWRIDDVMISFASDGGVSARILTITTCF